MRAKPVSFFVIGSAAVSLLCVFMPWAQLGPFSVTGIDTDDGKVAFVAAVIVVVLGLAAASGASPRITGFVAFLPACGIAYIGVVDTIDIGDAAGWGVLGIAVAGTACAVATLVLAFAEPEPKPVASTPIAPPFFVPPPMPAPASVEPRWAQDPTGRHQLRWWDGTAWTPHVSDGGVTALD
jgi:hypothetical protein